MLPLRLPHFPACLKLPSKRDAFWPYASIFGVLHSVPSELNVARINGNVSLVKFGHVNRVPRKLALTNCSLCNGPIIASHGFCNLQVES